MAETKPEAAVRIAIEHILRTVRIYTNSIRELDGEGLDSTRLRNELANKLIEEQIELYEARKALGVARRAAGRRERAQQLDLVRRRLGRP